MKDGRPRAKLARGSAIRAAPRGLPVSLNCPEERRQYAGICRRTDSCHKKGCVPSALTQNVKDLLASRQIENIFENSDFMVLLSQAQGDRQILARQLGISPHQLSYVTHSNPGEGLLFFGNVTIPFVDRFPKNTKLYSIMTTRPEEKEAQNG